MAGAKPPTRVELAAQRLDASAVDDLFARVSNVDPNGRAPRCELDLTPLTFIAPEGLSGIMLAVRVLHARGFRIAVRFPESPDAANYLIRMGLKTALKDFARCRAAPRARRYPWRTSDALLELTCIEKREDVEALLAHIDGQVRTILTSQLGYGPEDVANFATVISELTHNIVDHSEALGYVAAQRYTRRQGEGERFALITVADIGVGLRQSLGQRYDVSSWTDAQVIVSALLPAYSRHPDRGFGLAFVRKITSDYRGSLQIRTGTTRLVIRGRVHAFVGATFPGTQITISLSQRQA